MTVEYLMYSPLRLRARYTSYLAAPVTAFHFRVGRPCASLPPVTVGAAGPLPAKVILALSSGSLYSFTSMAFHCARVPVNVTLDSP